MGAKGGEIPMRYIVALILAVAVVSLACAPRPAAAAQQSDVDLGYLANPCRGVYRALLDQGLNPDAPTYGITQTFQNAHVLLLPVLADLATDPSLIDDTGRLRGRIQEAARSTVGMSERWTAAIARLAPAMNADPPSPGMAYIWSVLRDPTLGPPWIRVLTAERWALRSLSNC
jgi:hypothetical protein